MVKSATSYTGNGLRDWLIQRVSAVILGAYSIFLLLYIVSHPGLDYATWQSLFAALPMKIATLLMLFAVFAHAWIGVWTVLTDYVKPVHVRITLEMLVIVSLAAYLIWGVIVVWSV